MASTNYGAIQQPLLMLVLETAFIAVFVLVAVFLLGA
jgi:hypothetical protein